MLNFEELKQQIASIPLIPQRSRDALNTLVAEISRQRHEIEQLRERIFHIEERQ